MDALMRLRSGAREMSGCGMTKRLFGTRFLKKHRVAERAEGPDYGWGLGMGFGSGLRVRCFSCGMTERPLRTCPP